MKQTIFSLPKTLIMNGWRVLSFFVLSILILVLAMASNPTIGFAQHRSASVIKAEKLTQSLAAAYARYQQANSSNQAQLLEQLIETAASRQRLFADLVKENPNAVLRMALPAKLLTGMPDAVLEYLEQKVDIEGKLEVLAECSEHSSRIHHFLKANGKRYSLHFADKHPDMLSVANVRVNGLLVKGTEEEQTGNTDGAIVLKYDESNVQMLTDDGNAVSTTTESAPVLENTFGEQRTLVMLVNFQDKPEDKPWMLNEYDNLVFGSVSDYFLENSYGQTWLTGDTVGWYTLPVDSTSCEYGLIRAEADQTASDAGINLLAYTRFLYVFPHNSNCTWSGLGYVGGSPSAAWINGRNDIYVVAHELGHNFGLHHANSLECGSTTLGENCVVSTYGDSVDIMGSGDTGHFNAYHKDRLGWLGYNNSPQIMTVDIDTQESYNLTPYEENDAGNKALKILKEMDSATGEITWYYVEYRQAIGFDTFLSGYGENVVNGVVVHTGKDLNGNSSLLLNMAPDSHWLYDWKEPALIAGESFTDLAAGVTITTDWVDGSGASVSVNTAPVSCVQAPPSLSFLPDVSQWVEPGTPVNYTVTVTNNDNAGCASSAFDLSSDAPVAWTTAFSVNSLVLAPGVSSSTNFQVISPISADDDFYDIPVTAENSSSPVYTTSSSVTYIVSTTPVNQPPLTNSDNAITKEGASVTIDVLANDTDPDGDSLIVVYLTQGTYGSTVINPDNNTVAYSPNSGFSGVDNFTYTVSDGKGGSSTEIVAVTVKAVNQSPLAIDDKAITTVRTSVSIAVLSNDSDPDNDTLVISSISQGVGGTPVINGDGTVTYTPKRKFSGEDSFDYTISDGALTALATVFVTVNKDSGSGNKGGGKGGGKPVK